ncbi:hypothetical protein EVAR_62897_1 [Eumeta japonica]|uniref:Uncharacterized protein n=1 Tax=Eumeta variegata TaxID=151549 RepID=A0A4C1Y9V1_EUMVA|nr:hypothetical protein EVAR_62897_1 [Eumeta japonica]
MNLIPVDLLRVKSWLKDQLALQTIEKFGLIRNNLMLCVWWDLKGVIHYELLPPAKTIHPDLSCQQLFPPDKIFQGLLADPFVMHVFVYKVLIQSAWNGYVTDLAAAISAPATGVVLHRLGRRVQYHTEYGREVAAAAVVFRSFLDEFNKPPDKLCRKPKTAAVVEGAVVALVRRDSLIASRAKFIKRIIPLAGVGSSPAPPAASPTSPPSTDIKEILSCHSKMSKDLYGSVDCERPRLLAVPI